MKIYFICFYILLMSCAASVDRVADKSNNKLPISNNRFATYYSGGIKSINICKHPNAFSIDTNLIGKWKLDYTSQHGCLFITADNNNDKNKYIEYSVVFTDTNISWQTKITHPSIDDSVVTRKGIWYVENNKLYICHCTVWKEEYNNIKLDTINNWYTIGYEIYNDTLIWQSDKSCQSEYIKSREQAE